MELSKEEIERIAKLWGEPPSVEKIKKSTNHQATNHQATNHQATYHQDAYHQDDFHEEIMEARRQKYEREKEERIQEERRQKSEQLRKEREAIALQLATPSKEVQEIKNKEMEADEIINHLSQKRDEINRQANGLLRQVDPNYEMKARQLEASILELKQLDQLNWQIARQISQR